MAAGHHIGPVAIGVSGGSDSLALLKFADRWARDAGRHLLILSVDHGLRLEAGEEVRHVVALASRMGHEARALKWRPIDKAGQSAARRARHGLLAEAAREAEASLLLLGHTRSDVEETFLMRLARPTGLTGAVGPMPVSVSPVWPEGRGLTLARPLIATRREALQTWLQAEGAAWISDPSNEAAHYERVRVRKLARALPEGRALEAVLGDALLLRAREDMQLAGDIEQCTRVHASGLMEMEGLPESARACGQLVKVALQAASGSDSPPDHAKLQQFVAMLQGGGPETRQTLGGAWLQRRGNMLLVGRDPGEAQLQWENGVWDGRYVRTNHPASIEERPFLVRQTMPEDEAFHEIIGARLAHWAACLRAGAGFAAEFCGASAPDGLTTRRG
ncbi:tRNA lysidine(34) synthetase TilS [Henriciella aquimarina]|uniref:tRNA lysidine(34) synthetase TilS n=1 Tax=Henriciella aquimarina TaxID=545261 RepID=UPI00117B11B6|nr:tRNA lysidine(34) synthetase TilS [Henriciella aquimarina]